MAEILLTSERFVKETTAISDNIAGKYLLPSIREAQQIGLRNIVGDRLLQRLCTLVQSGDINKEANAVYKATIDKAQYYLAYMAVAELLPKVGYKVANAGVVTTPDDKVVNASYDDIQRNIDYYTAKADVWCMDLQYWLLDHREELPELSADDCRRIDSNLLSAASCGVWTGGARGKGHYPRRRTCRR